MKNNLYKTSNSVYLNSIQVKKGVIITGDFSKDSFNFSSNKKIDLKCHHLYIEKHGSLEGNIITTNAIICGYFEGKLTVRDTLYIEETAIIKGTISYKNLDSKGGKIIGELNKIS